MKNIKNIISSFLLISTIVVGLIAFSPKEVKAQTVINVSACGTLSTAGATYILTQNINTTTTGSCLTVGANNITLDGSNFTITGNNVGNGVYLNGRTGVTVKNLNVTKFSVGIRLNLSNSNTLTNNTASLNASYGINLSSSNGNTLIGNTANLNTAYYGIYLAASSNNTLTNNIANSNGDRGISFWSSSNNNVLTNNVTNSNGNYGINFSGSSGSNILINNIANSNNVSGIFLSSSSGNTLTGNITKENLSQDIQVTITSDEDCNNVIENTLGSGDRLIKYFNSSVNLQGEILSELILCNADGSTINNITISGSEIEKNNSLFAYRTDGSSFTNINSSNNNVGFIINNSSNNIVTGSTFSNNTLDGIRLATSNNNVLTNNIISGNIGYGIRLLGTTNNNNQIYSNNFIDNTIQAFVGGGTGNVFNNPVFPFGGNFWSQLALVDINNNGFIDSPFVINATLGIQDNLPWTVQDGWSTPPAITNAQVTPSILGTTAQITITKTVTDNLGVESVRADIKNSSNTIIGTVNLNLQSGTIQNGVWSGIFNFTTQADGTYTITDTATDITANFIEVTDGSVILDRTAPDVSIISITPDLASATGAVAVLVAASDLTSGFSSQASVTARDNTSGISATQTNFTGSLAAGQIGNWTFNQSAALPAGLHTEIVTSTDAAGNVNTTNGTYTVDTAIPTGSVIINGGATYSNLSANLTLTCTDNSGACAQMRIAVDGILDTEIYEPYTSSKAITLPAGDGSKTVSVTFKDIVGNVSAVVSDSITVETTPAVIADDVAVTPVYSPFVTLTGKVIDSGPSSSGVASFMIGDISVTLGGGGSYSQAITLVAGLNTINELAIDNAGNQTIATRQITYIPDFDQDGILNDVDLDDDNDGIADAVDWTLTPSADASLNITNKSFDDRSLDVANKTYGTVTATGGWTVTITDVTGDTNPADGIADGVRVKVTGTGTVAKIMSCSNNIITEFDTVNEEAIITCSSTHVKVIETTSIITTVKRGVSTYVSGGFTMKTGTTGNSKVYHVAKFDALALVNPATAYALNTSPVFMEVVDELENVLLSGELAADQTVDINTDTDVVIVDNIDTVQTFQFTTADGVVASAAPAAVLEMTIAQDPITQEVTGVTYENTSLGQEIITLSAGETMMDLPQDAIVEVSTVVDEAGVVTGSTTENLSAEPVTLTSAGTTAVLTENAILDVATVTNISTGETTVSYTTDSTVPVTVTSGETSVALTQNSAVDVISSTDTNTGEITTSYESTSVIPVIVTIGTVEATLTNGASIEIVEPTVEGEAPVINNTGDVPVEVIVDDTPATLDPGVDLSDQCPGLDGNLENTGCPFASKITVDLHKVYLGGGVSTKNPLAGALVSVFNRNSSAFQAIAGSKNPNGSLYGIIFEAGNGKIGNCVTGDDGICFAGSTNTGDVLIIVKYFDSATGKTVYTGLPGSSVNFVNNLLTKNFQIIKTTKKDGVVQFTGGSKLVVTGSLLEIITPENSIWDNNSFVYPFIFTSDSNWTVDVCANVPTGYDIVGVYNENGDLVQDTNCIQVLIANQMKVVAFEVMEVGSPEPGADFVIKTSHNGKKTEHKIQATSIRQASFDRELKRAKQGKVIDLDLGGVNKNYAPTKLKSVSLWNAAQNKLGASASLEQVKQVVKNVAQQNSIAIPEWGILGRLNARVLSASAIWSLFK